MSAWNLLSVVMVEADTIVTFQKPFDRHMEWRKMDYVQADEN